MTNATPLHAAIEAMPEAARAAIPALAENCSSLLSNHKLTGIRHIYITGCGDSYHAGVAAALAFRQMAGPRFVAPLTAMQLARYQASFLPPPGDAQSLIVGISASGQVSRTAEALELARLAGATTLAITTNLDGPLASEADMILQPPAPPAVQGSPELILPGATSYIISLLALYQLALGLGRQIGRLDEGTWRDNQVGLLRLVDHMESTIAQNEPVAARLVNAWATAGHFVYCGSGPSYGTALFSAAKLLEASGDIAVAQDMEEWAHLEYFGRETQAPTILISAGGRDATRVYEVAEAARTIGRRLAIIAPVGSAISKAAEEEARLTYHGDPPERFSPLLACIPGLLIAANRALLIDEPYFRAFGGGRSSQGGGGISRIRDSQRIHDLEP